MQIFMMLSAMNAGRPKERSLSDATEQLIANRITQFNRWFPIFAEFPALDDASIARFVSAADHIDSIGNPTLKANALGSFQAVVGLWGPGIELTINPYRKSDQGLVTYQPWLDADVAVRQVGAFSASSSIT